MRSWMVLFSCLVGFQGCSDFGTEPWTSWTTYDLPNGQISLPSELTRKQNTGRYNKNPQYAGYVGNQYLVVQFNLDSNSLSHMKLDYKEEAIQLGDVPAILYRCRGWLHWNDNQINWLLGVKADLRPGCPPVEVVVAFTDFYAYDNARRILLTMRARRETVTNQREGSL